MSEVVFSQEYERRAYDPPIPVLDVGVRRPGTNAPAIIVEAVVDTGADGSLFPLDILEQAGAAFVDRGYMRGITGQRQAVDLYLITVYIGRLRITGVRAVALPPGNTAILGRDVLNQLDLALRGLASVTEVLA
jgi:predicted aspartyl protease